MSSDEVFKSDMILNKKKPFETNHILSSPRLYIKSSPSFPFYRAEGMGLLKNNSIKTGCCRIEP